MSHHKYISSITTLSVVGMVFVWAYVIFVLPDPGDIIAQRDQTFKAQWGRINENTSLHGKLEQRLDDFEAEMRRSVNPEAWIELARIRQDIADLKADIKALENPSVPRLQ